MAANLAALNQGPTIDWDSGPELFSRYKKWKQKCTMIFEGPLATIEEAIKCKYLIIWAGDRGLDLYNSWGMTDAHAKELKFYWQNFEEYVNPQANFLIARHKLRNSYQGDKTFEEFLTEIRLTNADCGYHDNVKDEMLRDTIVFGIKDEKVRLKCIEKGNDLTLKLATEYARTAEATQSKAKELHVDSGKTVDAFYKTSYGDKKRGGSKPPMQNTSQNRQNARQRQTQCYFCGYPRHTSRDQCPAKNANCDKCSKMGHFASVCLSTNSEHGGDRQQHRRRVHELDMDTAEEFSSLFVGSITAETIDNSKSVHKLDMEDPEKFQSLFVG